MKKEVGIIFVILALISLLLGLVFGSIGSFQFLYPDFLKEIPFFKSRPLHVSFVVSWIFLSSIGGIYYYLPRVLEIPLFSRKLAMVHVWLFIITGVLVAGSYLFGKFGGREYWEFPVIFAIPIYISWLIFGWNFFRTIRRKIGQWPVYIWMWATGIVFFLFTFTESYLWLFPYFRDHLVRDLTVQWKAYGALVGSWNMLVYGTALFIMEQIKKDGSVARSRLAFLMYFLGFTNLLFGWAHHLYTVPNQSWIRYLSYLISMTELIILARIIYKWRSSLTDAMKEFSFIPAKFLTASEIWIFLNLTLALAISIPGINVWTHGTHITVAHAMGSSIGINTMILIASVMFIVNLIAPGNMGKKERKKIVAGYWIMNISLFIFWCSLIGAGVMKGKLIMENELPFQLIMTEIRPFMIAFAWAGLGIFSGLLLVILPSLEKLIDHFRT